jgi:hypothetical protein
LKGPETELQALEIIVLIRPPLNTEANYLGGATRSTSRETYEAKVISTTCGLMQVPSFLPDELLLGVLERFSVVWGWKINDGDFKKTVRFRDTVNRVI